MPRKTEILNQSLAEARGFIRKGDTAAAHNLCRLIEVDAYVAILDRLTEIEKHLAALAMPFYEATRAEQPIDFEKIAKKGMK